MYCPKTQDNVSELKCRTCQKRLCDAFFCLVVGSRSFSDYDLLSEKLNYYLSGQNDIVIVSGGAEGADALAAQYAKSQGYEFITP